MADRDWDFFIWQHASELLRQAERIQMNFLQFATAAEYRVPHTRMNTWAPPMNVIETERSLWVMAALPGVETTQLEVRLDGTELVISGNRPPPDCCKEGDLKIWELPLGPFERRLSVVGGSRPPDLGKIAFENGLLIVELRKQS